MTTLVYNNARSLFATGALDWLTCSPHAVLVNSGYAPQPGDVYFSTISGGAVMKDVAMTGVGQTNGVCYGVIPEFLAFTAAVPVTALVIYASTGNPATSPLIYYSDDGVGFPFTPLGFNYAVGFDQASGGYFQA